MRRIGWWGPPALIALTLFFLSAQERLPAAPSNDKLAHLIAYAVLAASLARAVWFDTVWSSLKLVLFSVVLASLYGVSDEWHQSFVPGRDASLGDMVADALGAVIGALLAILGLSWAARRFPSWAARGSAGACPKPSASSPR